MKAFLRTVVTASSVLVSVRLVQLASKVSVMAVVVLTV